MPVELLLTPCQGLNSWDLRGPMRHGRVYGAALEKRIIPNHSRRKQSYPNVRTLGSNAKLGVELYIQVRPSSASYL